jgi:hypothetical protein
MNMEFPQSLLQDPTIVAKAQAAGQTPAEYLTAMRAGMVDPNRAPILNSLEVSPNMMQPQTEVAPTVSPVLSQAEFESQVANNQVSGQGFRTPTIEPARPVLEAPVDALNAPVLDTSPTNRPTAMQGPQDLPEIPEGFEVLKMPTGMDQSVLFNPSTGETRPYTNSSRQLFSNPQLERDIQSLARSTYGTLKVDGPLITAQREAKAAAEALAANETQENLNASLNANAALEEAQAAVKSYNPNVENATAESVQVFKNVPHGLEQVAQDNLQRPALRSPDFTQLEAENSQSPALQAPVDFAAMEAQNSKSPVLINTTTPAPTTTTAAQTPVLGGSSTSSSRSPILSRGAGNMTANARGSALGMIPRGEALMRIGGQMYSGALQGDGLGAATREYGAIQDANRKAEVDAYNKAEATRIAELRARGTGSKAAGKEAAKNAASLQSVNDAMYGMQRGLDAIADSRASGGNLTGIGGIFKGIFDNFTGDPDANRRMILSRLRVDDALLRVAETKGAISNAEMKLFLSPAPTNLQDEQVWEDWINERMAALQRVQNRLSGDEELPAGQRSNEFNTSSGTYTPSADVQAVLDKYN